MTDVVSPTPVANLSIPRGATRTVRMALEKANSITGVNDPLDLSLPGTVLVFTAKIRDHEDPPSIQKSYAATLGVLPPGTAVGGITVQQITVGAVQVWVADVKILSTDTQDLDASYLSYDVWAFDLSGEGTPVVEGRLRITPTTLFP